MTNHAAWKRQQSLRAWLVCLTCLLVFLVFRAGWVRVDSVKAALWKQATRTTPAQSNPFHHTGDSCSDSSSSSDAASAYDKLINIDLNSI